MQTELRSSVNVAALLVNAAPRCRTPSSNTGRIRLANPSTAGAAHLSSAVAARRREGLLQLPASLRAALKPLLVMKATGLTMARLPSPQ